MFSRLVIILGLWAVVYLAAVQGDLTEKSMSEKMGIDATKNKLGMIYHEFAAKIDGLLGDEEARRVHQFEVDKGKVREEIENLKDSMAESASNAGEKSKGMMDKVKEWTGIASDASDNLRDRAEELKDKAKESASDSMDSLKSQAANLKAKVSGDESSGFMDDARELSSQLKSKAAYYLGFGKAKGQDMADKAQQSIDSTKEKASGWFSSAKDKVQEAQESGKIKAEEMKDAASEKAENAKGVFAENYDAAKNKAKSAAERVKEAFTGSS